MDQLIEEGLVIANRSKLPAYALPKITLRGKSELSKIENNMPKWRSWNNGWKEWLGGAALIAGLIFTILKVIEFFNK